MGFIKFTVPFLLVSSLVTAQEFNTNWYSETVSNGITIQNSFPKGGPYTGTTNEHFNYSYLVFYTRIINESGKTFEIKTNFSADPIRIPNTANTYLKLFLPSDKMTPEKHNLFSYGITELKSLDDSTSFQKTLKNNEECLFYVVAVFYQKAIDAQYEERGGNRAEFLLKGQELFFRMPPQVEYLQCGYINFDN